MSVCKNGISTLARGVLGIPAPIIARVDDETLRMLSDDGKFDRRGLAVLCRSFVEMRMFPEEPDMSRFYKERFLPGAAH